MGGGGGGNTTTTTSGVPEWLRPDVQKAFGKATAASDAGALSQVAELDPRHEQMLLDTAFGGGLQAANERTLTNLAGQQLAGQANKGTLGSARADRARQAALADTGAKLAQQDLQVRDQAAQQLLGQEQKKADATHQGLQRLFGYYGSGAAGSQSTASQGGGK